MPLARPWSPRRRPAVLAAPPALFAEVPPNPAHRPGWPRRRPAVLARPLALFAEVPPNPARRPGSPRRRPAELAALPALVAETLLALFTEAQPSPVAGSPRLDEAPQGLVHRADSRPARRAAAHE